MTIRSWADRERKAEIRKLALPNRPVRMALMMPAAEALDVRLGLETGVFTPDTWIACVEEHPETYAVMVRTLEGIEAEYGLRCEPITILRAIHMIDLRFLPLPIDYAFLDFCDAFSAELLFWIKWRLAPMLAPGATLAITQKGADRGSARFFRHCAAAITEETDYFTRDRGIMTGIDDPMRWVPHAQISLALEGFRWTGGRPIRYGDTQDMFLIALDDLTRTGGPRPGMLERVLGRVLGEAPLRDLQEGLGRDEEVRLRASETRRRNDAIRTLAAERLAGTLEALGSELTVRQVLNADKQKDPVRVLAGFKAWATRRQQKAMQPG
jgi:hypothetical protein